ncbi:MAG: hypothetical protein V1872_07845 [bacterium]
MWNFLNQIKLIRYLVVWKVNSSFVKLPPSFSPELSRVLGTIISKRLSTREAKPWHKGLISGGNEILESEEQGSKTETLWPIESVLLVYPAKLSYGTGEFIIWELKLLGEQADHGFFLEVILPAIEEASYTSDRQWGYRNGLWGHFDIQSVYVARGYNWQPLVNNGRLDLRCQVSPEQWAEGLSFTSPIRLQQAFRGLTWLTPFDIREICLTKCFLRGCHKKSTISLQGILELLILRLNYLIFGKNYTTHLNPKENCFDINLFSPSDQKALQAAINDTKNIPTLSEEITYFSNKKLTGERIGKQTFTSNIPSSVIPYLELASILHVGRKTHFGCGTFYLN